MINRRQPLTNAQKRLYSRERRPPRSHRPAARTEDSCSPSTHPALIRCGGAFCHAFVYPQARAVSALLFPARKRYAREKRRIALLIPARDESRVIGDLFDSILRQTYDRENFDVNVIVKRADDPTVEMAKKLGFSVFVVPDQTCKGAALDGSSKASGRSIGRTALPTASWMRTPCSPPTMWNSSTTRST